MQIRNRIRALIAIMILVTVGTSGLIVQTLYAQHLERERVRLRVTAQSQARLIEAVADFDLEHSAQSFEGDAFAATLSQLKDAHEHFEGFGATGEFTLARLEAGEIVFLLSQRYTSLGEAASLPISTALAEPMRRALRGESGALIGPDYRGETVVAAFEPVMIPGPPVGIVAKIDLAEVRKPFIRAGLLSLAAGGILVLVGVFLFGRIGYPLIRSLEESETRLGAVMDAAPTGIVTVGGDEFIIGWNAQARALFGYTKEEILGRPLSALMPERYRNAHASGFERHTCLGTGQVTGPTVEVAGLRKDGSEFPLELSVARWEAEGRPFFTGFLRDVTERRQAEDQRQKDAVREAELENRLRHAQKMEAIGTLAGGIAHDFNNLLQAMLGSLDLAQADVPPDSPAAACLEDVATAGKRARDLVGQILAFSRYSEQERRPLQLQPVLNEVLKLLRSSLPATIEIRQSIDADCGPVLADATEVHQVAMNLCMNAYHAMGECGGVIDVRLEEITVDREAASLTPNLEEGRMARLSVRDTGPGMDARTLDRIFDPYFTTKAVGEGTGLGLATVHGIVEGSGGVIRVESDLGVGTLFEIYFPVRSRKTDAAGPIEIDKSELPLGTERILVVDDEPLVASVIRRGLEHLGYDVESLTSSVDALATFRAAPERFDVVITDQTMPEMTGMQLAREMALIRPDIPVILCSGFSGLADEAGAEAACIRAYANKPILPFDLATLVREIVGE